MTGTKELTLDEEREVIQQAYKSLHKAGVNLTGLVIRPGVLIREPDGVLSKIHEVLLIFQKSPGRTLVKLSGEMLQAVAGGNKDAITYLLGIGYFPMRPEQVA